MESSQFLKVKKYSEASGSMAVVDSNIQMKMNDFGLFEESIKNEALGVSDAAIRVSPNFNNKISESDIAKELYSDNDMYFDERIGYFISNYVGYVKEGDFRKNASSGGMGTWIFKELFEKDLIDYVIHVKQNDHREKLFKYEISSNITEIKAGAKTKYYPVELSEVLEKVKTQPGRYAIIGIPSFIYSIRLLAREDEIIKERIKYTIGLICGHQKSSKFAESMAWQVGIKPGDLEYIDFRHKLLDRPANSYGVKMVGLVDGERKTIIKPKTELFGQNWGWGFFKPIASNYTDDVFNETADVVLGDAWLPEYTSDSEGNNIVIVRNSEINELIKDAIKSNRLKMDKVDKDIIFSSQASHYRHTHDELAYRLLKIDKNNEWRPLKRVDASSDISNTRGKIQDLRTMISEQSHIQYMEALKRKDFSYFTNTMSEYITDYSALYRKISRNGRIRKILQMGPRKMIQKIVNRIL